MIDSWVAEGEHWQLEGEYEPTLKARGPIIELHLNWLDCLTFSDGDAFHWTKVGVPTRCCQPACDLLCMMLGCSAAPDQLGDTGGPAARNPGAGHGSVKS